jgi:hypothetical protein
VRVAAEAGKNRRHLLVHHGVARDAIVEVFLLRRSAVRRRAAGSRLRGSRRARRAARSDSRDNSRMPSSPSM